jgi:hypothetical protein
VAPWGFQYAVIRGQGKAVWPLFNDAVLDVQIEELMIVLVVVLVLERNRLATSRTRTRTNQAMPNHLLSPKFLRVDQCCHSLCPVDFQLQSAT